MKYFTIIALLFSVPCWAQFQLQPVPRDAKNKSTARTQEIELELPFWDDFSFTKDDQPIDTLWLNGTTVWVNNGMGINPPSLNVATFDGLGENGTPYNVNNVLAKGFADNLESHIIRLDKVDESQRISVYFSFYYQMKGRGEIPDQGDLLFLQFKNAEAKWETVWSRENDGTLEADQFTQVLFPVNEKYFHDKFQFRFQNFGRLSGPYDTWHVDYVYLDQGRSTADLTYPDRALVNSLGSLFGSYWSIPIKHFKQAPALVKPTFEVENHCDGASQPISFLSSAYVKTFVGEDPTDETILLEDATNNALAVPPLQKTVYQLNTIPQIADLNLDADSLEIKLEIVVDSDDETGGPGAVCNPSRYPTIDFTSNDSTSAVYTLSNYYAYDDGTAEYGAGLNQPGAQLAYEFNLTGPSFDSLAAIDLYFPRFGDESSQVLELRVWRALTDDPDDIIYRETVTIERSQQNVFWRKKLPESRRVPAKFYVGWKQSSAALISVGLDKNSDTGSKMFYNTSGTWQANTSLEGNFMIRPVFGKGRKGDETGLEKINRFQTYPNPSKGSFYFKGQSTRTSVCDAMGRPISFDESRVSDDTQIVLHGAMPGVYILKAELEGVVRTAKILVIP